MSNDQAQNNNGAESLSPEIADYFQVDQAAEVKGTEKVTPTGEEKTPAQDENKGQADPAKPAEGKPEAKDGEQKPDEKKEGEGQAPAPTTYSVAGTEYKTLDEAIAAVNRINGDNTRLSGDLTKAEQRALDAENAAKAKDIALEQYIKANQAWKDYFDGNGEKPAAPDVNLDELLDKKLAERERQREQARIKEQRTTEEDQVKAKADFADVQAVYEELVSEAGDNPKVSPLKLYERARAIVLAKKPTTDLDAIRKEIEEKVRKELSKQDLKVVGGKNGGATPKDDEDLSPELADYFRNRI